MPQIIKKCEKFKLNFPKYQKGRENSNSPIPFLKSSLLRYSSRLSLDNDIQVTNWHQKEKKGNKYLPQKCVHPSLIYIFFIFFFPASTLLGSWVGLWRSRRKRHQWRNTWDDAPLKIWWWEIGSCIGMECSGRNSNFLFTNSKPIKLNDHCNFMIGKIAVRPFSTAQVQEMDSKIKYSRIPI